MRRILACAAGGLAASAVLLPATATATNRQIAISNYAWSDSALAIDLGEHVTWHWIGPDTMHSITGTSSNAIGLDSDPRISQPKHKIGDSFRLDFDQPGVYSFQCKLHSTVNGTVEVSADPGDPISEPDPVPKSRVDLRPPNLRSIELASTAFGRRGAALRYALDEPARLTAEYFRLTSRGGRQFAGYARHKGGHIGLNSLRFGVERTHFDARPGRYLAKVAATDRSANRTRPLKLRFRILGRRR